MKGQKCCVCDFDKYSEKHHIIKRKDYGSDDEDNLIYLCPNHHWIADFGDEKDREFILNKIKEITGKKGKRIEGDYLNELKRKARRLVEERLHKYNSKEWIEKDMENTFSFEAIMKSLRSKSYGYIFNKKAELLLLRDKINEELIKCRI